jgi:nucleotide-binding universal stress UspA family protein
MIAPPQPRVGSPLVVPFDGSASAEAVLPFAPLLVDGPRDVILLQIVSEPREVRGPLGELMLSADEMRRAAESAAQADLRRAESALAALDAALRLERVVDFGEPAERIVEVAAQRGAHTLLLASQGMSATGPGGFGSVVGRVVRTASMPVIVIRPGSEPTTVTRLVVAYDGSERAARALPLAQDLARRLSAHVHVVAVVEDEESPIPLAIAAALAPHLRSEASADARNAAQRRVEAIGAHLLQHGLPASWEVRRGPAARAIIEACAPHDLLVITPHGQTGGCWTLGSIAEKLVRESPVPVLLVRSQRDLQSETIQ